MTTLDDDVVAETPAELPRLNGPTNGHHVANYPVMAESADFEDFPAEIGKYEDFHTIDWQRDLGRDRIRHREIVKGKRISIGSRICAVFDAGSGWICVLLVGMTAGFIAGMMDIGTYWLSDLKDGLCVKAFYLNREQCCWAANDTMDVMDHQRSPAMNSLKGKCAEWHTWPEIFLMPDGELPSYFVEYVCYVLWAVGLAGMSALLVREFAPYACGAGIAEIKCILSGFIMRGFLGKWTLIIKSVGLMLSVASGLSLGKEGPMVHLGCCIGNIFSYIFPKYGKNEAKKREILSAACAAGISVAFGAPVGGVLFSLEEASYYFPLKTLWRSFFCALVAGLFLRFINPFGSDQTSLFYIDYAIKWSYFELIPFILIGVAGGLIGVLFIKVNMWWCHIRKTTRLGKYPIAEVTAMAVLTALVSFPNEFTRMSATNLIKMLFDRCRPEENTTFCAYEVTNSTTYQPSNPFETGVPVGFLKEMGTALWMLALALFVKMFLTFFTIGMKVPAGMFIPSKAIGALFGRLVGLGMLKLYMMFPPNKNPNDPINWIWTTNAPVEPGLYAIVGAAAVVGGTTRLTVSLVVIMFELTGRQEIVVPTMAAVMFSKWVGDYLCKEGICDAQIQLNNYPFLDNKEEFSHCAVAKSVMRPQPGDPPLKVLTQETMTVYEIDEMLRETDFNGFPIVISQESQYVVGFVTRRDLNLTMNSALKTRPDIQPDSVVIFTPDSYEAQPDSPAHSNPAKKPLRLTKLLDLAPITITDQTPMETVIDMFRKLGLRQVLVIHNGKLQGMITKKDVLKHIADLDHEE